MTPLHDVTLVVTSCGRPDLLFRTLDSLEREEPYPFAARIIIEDSADRATVEAIRSRYPGDTVLFNDPQIGQMRSIDRAYARVRTPYVFHCEDDWAFEGGPFVDRAIGVLEADVGVSVVCVRRLEEIADKFLQTPPRRTVAGTDVVKIDPAAHPEWFGYGFNPGLARMETYRAHGPFEPFGTEAAISVHFKGLGFTTAYLTPGHARHIGGDAHVDDPFQPKRPTGLASRLRHSFVKRAGRLRRRIGH
ncbi:MAG: glycosyltransferase family 2 protein [Hyphomicrobiaceae bacterium]